MVWLSNAFNYITQDGVYFLGFLCLTILGGAYILGQITIYKNTHKNKDEEKIGQ